MRRSALWAALAVGAILATGNSSRAGFIPFTYVTDVSPAGAIAPDTTVGGPGSSFALSSFTDGLIHNAAGAGSSVQVATLTLSDLGVSSDYTDTYSRAISILVHITDGGGGGTGDITLTGTLGSTVTAVSSVINATYTPPSFGAGSPASITLGQNVYTVTAVAGADFNPPGSPPTGGAGSTGGYSFVISAQAVPEPSSMVLLGLGGAGALGLFFRRGRGKAISA
jgi:hypothetical protein